jgi:hypothetical protein
MPVLAGEKWNYYNARRLKKLRTAAVERKRKSLQTTIK